MDKDKEIAMKQHVLGMLHNFMMEGEGSKFKPKAIEVDMVSEPKKSLVEDGADEESPMEDMGEDPEAEEEDGKKGKMSLKDFLASRG